MAEQQRERVARKNSILLMWRNILLVLLACSISMAVAACGLLDSRPPVSPTPSTPASPGASPGPPTSTLPPPTATIASATLEAQLAATVTAELPPPPTPDETGFVFGSFEGVGVVPLEHEDEGQPFYAAYTQGLRAAEQSHFIAIYSYTAEGWQQIDRVELDMVDILPAEGVQQVSIAPDYAWLEAEGGVGAHGGMYMLFRFDGDTLRSEIEASSANPGVGVLQDLNGDDVPEVVLDQSDYYVFCYACGVVEVFYRLVRWDGSRLVDVALEPLPDTAPADLRAINDEVITLAQAGLWLDASILAGQMDDMHVDNQHPTATWNSTLIRLIADGRAEHARMGEYPLLGNLFYGDYTAVLGILSGYRPEELFSQPNPLVAGTVAQGWEDNLTATIQTYTSDALALQPDLAEAYFLRGWAHYLAEPGSEAALADVQRAYDLQPAQPLFADSLDYLRNQQHEPVGSDQQAIAAASYAYMQQRTASQPNIEDIIIEKQAGNYARTRIVFAGDDEPLVVFLQREGTRWQVIAEGSGDPQQPDDLQEQGIPPELLEAPDNT
jgi:hypothetical protein